jgi:hypothetical protein
VLCHKKAAWIAASDTKIIMKTIVGNYGDAVFNSRIPGTPICFTPTRWLVRAALSDLVDPPQVLIDPRLPSGAACLVLFDYLAG